MKFRAILIIAGLFLAGFAGHSARAANDEFSVLDAPQPLPDFSLVNQNGEAFSRSDLLNHWSLAFVGFTSCKMVCPMTLMKLEALRAELGLRVSPDIRPEIVFVAVDPARDQPVLKSYLAHFDPDNIGVTGAKEEIDKFVAGLDAAYRFAEKRPGSDYYDVLHTSAIAVINPRGELVAQMNPPFDVQPMAQFMVGVIRSKSTPVDSVADTHTP